MDREVSLSRIKTREITIEDLSRGVHSKRVSMDREAIEHLLSIQRVSRWIKQLSRSYQECDKKKLKWLDRQPSYQEVSSSYRDYLKTVFQRREKHRHECNQTCYSTKDPNNILSSQNHLSTRKMSSIQIQNTHTLNKSNQFYISKNKLRQFSEHTLTHVFLVMFKSHCTCTCIKSSKEYCVLCVKNITRLHKCLHVMAI